MTPDTPDPVTPSSTPFELWTQANGDRDEYLRLMREHGHVLPGKRPPGEDIFGHPRRDPVTPLTDPDKLRTLATWFDHFDDWREATNKIAPGIAEYREVQADLRRMAATLDAARSTLAPTRDPAMAEPDLIDQLEQALSQGVERVTVSPGLLATALGAIRILRAELDAARQSNGAEAGLLDRFIDTREGPVIVTDGNHMRVATELELEFRAALQAAPVSIDRERLARAICATREPVAYPTTDDIFVDDECRSWATRILIEYDRLSHAK